MRACLVEVPFSYFWFSKVKKGLTLEKTRLVTHFQIMFPNRAYFETSKIKTSKRHLHIFGLSLASSVLIFDPSMVLKLQRQTLCLAHPCFAMMTGSEFEILYRHWYLSLKKVALGYQALQNLFALRQSYCGFLALMWTFPRYVIFHQYSAERNSPA